MFSILLLPSLAADGSLPYHLSSAVNFEICAWQKLEVCQKGPFGDWGFQGIRGYGACILDLLQIFVSLEMALQEGPPEKIPAHQLQWSSLQLPAITACIFSNRTPRARWLHPVGLEHPARPGLSCAEFWANRRIRVITLPDSRYRAQFHRPAQHAGAEKGFVTRLSE